MALYPLMLTCGPKLPHPAVPTGQSGASHRHAHIGGGLTVPQRLAKWFTTLSPKDKAKIVKDVTQLVLARRTRMCNFLEYKGSAPRRHAPDSPGD